jgi:hypothetical protein
MEPIPEPTMALPGAGCLLCILTATAASSTLTEQVKTFSSDELASLPSEVKTVLEVDKKNVSIVDAVIQIDELPDSEGGENKPRKNFTELAKKYNVDQLLVIDIDSHGATRPYSSYFPTGAPEASINGKAYIIDLKSNDYLWYLPLSMFKGAGGETWDEAPEYPGITNSYYQILEEFRDGVLNAISQKAAN